MTAKISTTGPSSRNRKTARKDVIELVETALENRGQWIEMEVENKDPNWYRGVQSAVAKKIGVQVSMRDSTVFLYIPEEL